MNLMPGVIDCDSIVLVIAAIIKLNYESSEECREIGFNVEVDCQRGVKITDSDECSESAGSTC